MNGSISSFFVGVPGGLIMSFIAFSIVFIVIIGLMLVMMGMEYVCGAIDAIKAAKQNAPAASAPSAPAAPAKAVAAPAAPAPAAAADDELLAVITAAIAAACGPAARVISYSPVKAPASSAWKNMGRLQNVEGLY